MLCRIYKLMGTKVEVNNATTIIPLSPKNFLTEYSRALLKRAGVGYRAETLIKAAMTIDRAH